MDQDSTHASRKEILPAFAGTLIGAVVLFLAMNALQPMLMENHFIHDFGTMLAWRARCSTR